MILNETMVDGINNSTVLLQQKNHDAVQRLKYNYRNLCGVISSLHCTVFDSGKIVDVGPGVELKFFNGYVWYSAVLYGDVDKIKDWIKKTVEQLKNQ